MNRDFILGHWILTLLCGPLIFAIIGLCSVEWNSDNLMNYMQLYPIMLFMGFAFSLPTYLIYSFVFRITKNKDIKMIYEKMILIIIVVCGIFITTAIIKGTLWFDIAISYSISSIIIGLFFKLNFKCDKES